MRLPTGNGYYIWILDRCAGGDPQAIKEKALRSGLHWVAIKIADGMYPFNQKAKLAQTVTTLKDAGVAVFGWQYVYGYNPVREAEMAAQQMNLLGLDGFIIDAESEFKKPGMGSVATSYVDTLNKRITAPIGLTAFRFPTYHPEFPWKQFLPRMDFHQPQVYWMGATNAGYQLRRSIREFDTLYRNLGMRTDIPTQPLGAAFTEHGWSPTMAEIIEFRKTAMELKLPGYGWWEWYFAETRNPQWWQASTEAIPGEQPPAEDPTKPEQPVPVPQRLVTTRFYNLRMRSGPSVESSSLGYLPQFSVFAVKAEQGDWLSLDLPRETWVHRAYMNDVTRAVCRIPDLRFRSGPSLAYTVLGYMQKDAIFNIVAVSGKWGRLEGLQERWVHLDYITTL